MGRRGLLHTLGSASAMRKRPSLLSTTPAAAVRFHRVLHAVESDPASVNRHRRCPVSVLLSHHRCLIPRHHRPVLMLCHSDDDEKPIGHCLLFGCHVVMGDVAPGLCVSTGMRGRGELSSSAFFRLVMGAPGPLWWYRYLALLSSRVPDVKCAFVLGRQGAASSLCWRSAPSVDGGDTWLLWRWWWAVAVIGGR